MSSSDDMYERGWQDAALEDFNPFYYQHYYYYRRGYNDGRRHIRRATDNLALPARSIWFWVLILLLAGLAGAGVLLFPGRHASRSASAVPTPGIQPTTLISAAATQRPQATPTAEASAIPEPVLQLGRQARVVNLGDALLLARKEPGINQPVQVRFPGGTEVTILEGPVEADGYTWWRIEGSAGSGWSAQQSLDGTVWLEPL